VIGAWAVPGQTRTTMFFVILVTHPNYIETMDRRDFGGKSSKWRWGRVIVKNTGILYRGWSQIQKTVFFAFWGTFRLSCAHPTRNRFTPNQWHRWKAETLKVCFLLVWRVCAQAFGRYRPLKGAEKWSRDIMKIGNLHIETRIKIHW